MLVYGLNCKLKCDDHLWHETSERKDNRTNKMCCVVKMKKKIVIKIKAEHQLEII